MPTRSPPGYQGDGESLSRKPERGCGSSRTGTDDRDIERGLLRSPK
jgi:hypothetical protein